MLRCGGFDSSKTFVQKRGSCSARVFRLMPNSAWLRDFQVIRVSLRQPFQQPIVAQLYFHVALFGHIILTAPLIMSKGGPQTKLLSATHFRSACYSTRNGFNPMDGCHHFILLQSIIHCPILLMSYRKAACLAQFYRQLNLPGDCGQCGQAFCRSPLPEHIIFPPQSTPAPPLHASSSLHSPALSAPTRAPNRSRAS